MCAADRCAASHAAVVTAVTIVATTHVDHATLSPHKRREGGMAGGRGLRRVASAPELESSSTLQLGAERVGPTALLPVCAPICAPHERLESSDIDVVDSGSARHRRFPHRPRRCTSGVGGAPAAPVLTTASATAFARPAGLLAAPDAFYPREHPCPHGLVHAVQAWARRLWGALGEEPCAGGAARYGDPAAHKALSPPHPRRRAVSKGWEDITQRRSSGERHCEGRATPIRATLIAIPYFSA